MLKHSVPVIVDATAGLVPVTGDSTLALNLAGDWPRSCKTVDDKLAQIDRFPQFHQFQNSQSWNLQ